MNKIGQIAALLLLMATNVHAISALNIESLAVSTPTEMLWGEHCYSSNFRAVDAIDGGYGTLSCGTWTHDEPFLYEFGIGPVISDFALRDVGLYWGCRLLSLNFTATGASMAVECWHGSGPWPTADSVMTNGFEEN